MRREEKLRTESFPPGHFLSEKEYKPEQIEVHCVLDEGQTMWSVVRVSTTRSVPEVNFSAKRVGWRGKPF